MSSPNISVIIPCFNHGEYLPEAVASVTALKRDDAELIVVNDGSTDERTGKEMEALAAQGIQVIRQENKGLSAARNAGILASQGKYILPLDADNHLRSGLIEQGMRILDANPQVGVVYGDAEYIGARTGRWQVGAFDRDKLLEWNCIDACALYRRAVWEQNGGYDSRMVHGLEDWDFWLGALEHGWQFAYVPEVVFEYRVAQESMLTRSHVRVRQNEQFVATKHGLLYRQAWQQRGYQQESVKWACRNLARVLRSRLKKKIQK